MLTPLPSTLAASLADCASVTGSVSVRPQGMSFDQTTQIRIQVTADQIFPQVRSVIATITGVESDWQLTPTLSFGFETVGNSKAGRSSRERGRKTPSTEAREGRYASSARPPPPTTRAT